MKKLLSLFILIALAAGLHAQTANADSLANLKVVVNKDARLDILAKVQADYNSMALKYSKGYRLLVLKTDDRDYAMKVRAYLLQTFPEEKVIMTYQAPFIKLKFGDFVEKEEAEKYRDMIVKGRAVTGNIYVVAEMVELKPDKYKEQDEQ